MFFQMYDAPEAPLTRAEGASQRLHGQTHLTPAWIKEKPASSPLLVYSWQKTLQALNDLRDEAGDPYDGIALEYTHPQTGGPVLPTLACWVQLIRPGERLRAHRQTGSAVYYIVQGEGTTVIDGQAFLWRKGDVVALPSWALNEHQNTSPSDDAILFSIQDRPVLEALNLYREEAYEENDGHQPVTSTSA